MDIQFFGANCIKLSNKKVSLVIDDTLAKVGLKTITKAEDIALFTEKNHDESAARFTIDSPGEYEISEVSIMGIPVPKLIDDKEKAIIYSIQLGDLSIGVLGHVNPNLTDDQLEAIGIVDILFVPVGGNGYTIDGVGAVQVIKKIEPKVVIPTHYDDSKVKFEVPQQDISVFLHEIGAQDIEPVSLYKVKRSDLSEKTQIVIVKS
jgi:L-ascorbate metabolism protein UlaG (beta-lactamase superfamily)